MHNKDYFVYTDNKICMWKQILKRNFMFNIEAVSVDINFFKVLDNLFVFEN